MRTIVDCFAVLQTAETKTPETAYDGMRWNKRNTRTKLKKKLISSLHRINFRNVNRIFFCVSQSKWIRSRVLAQNWNYTGTLRSLGAICTCLVGSVAGCVFVTHLVAVNFLVKPNKIIKFMFGAQSLLCFIHPYIHLSIGVWCAHKIWAKPEIIIAWTIRFDVFVRVRTAATATALSYGSCKISTNLLVNRREMCTYVFNDII